MSSSPADRSHGLFSRRLNHLELLLTLIILLVVQSFLSDENVFQRALYNLLFLAVVISAIRTLSESRTRLITAVTAGVIAYAVSWFTHIGDRYTLSLAIDCCYIVVFTVLFIALAESVFREGPVDANRIMGAVSIYFVFGFIWAFVYSLLETSQPGSFTMSKPDAGQLDLVGEFLYFSMVTLTTLGYGDMAPVSPPARMLATLEAVTGQLYVAIIIARLVGLQINQKRSESES